MTNLKIKIKTSLIIFVGAFFGCFFAFSSARALTFEQKRQAWIDAGGTTNNGVSPSRHWLCWAGRTHVFAWLEKGTHQICDADKNNWDCVGEILNSYINQKEYGGGKVEECTFANNSDLFILPDAFRAVYQYLDKIDPALVTKLKTSMNNDILNRYYAFSFGPTSYQHVQSYVSATKFLLAEEQKNLSGQYLFANAGVESGGTWSAFSYNGQNYVLGGTYNLFNLTRDWMYRQFDYWVENQAMENDSPTYAVSGLNLLLLLYDFSDRKLPSQNNQPDPEGLIMKRKTKMMTDLYLLDLVMDYAGNNLGGVLGRPKSNYFTNGGAFFFPFYQYFDLPNTDGSSTFSDIVYASSYRVPSLIYDLGNLSDENDFYWHINKEKFRDKQTFVTKHFGLGSNPGGEWRLNIKSDDLGVGKATPFDFWINNEFWAINPSREDGGESTIFGERGYQNNNFLLIKNDGSCGTENWRLPKKCATDTFKIHIFRISNRVTFDEGEDNLVSSTTGDYVYNLKNPNSWNFFREGKTMLAIKIIRNGSRDEWVLLETGVLGVDYPSFNSFKMNVQTKTGITLNTSLEVIAEDSKGDKLRLKTRANGEFIVIDASGKQINANNPRLEVTTNSGDKPVSWNGKIMTVKKGSKQCIYNFETWTYSGSGCEGGGSYKADFNSDGKVDIQDFGIMLSRWNKTINLIFREKNLDLAPNNKIDTSDLGALLGCWGTQDKKACLEE